MTDQNQREWPSFNDILEELDTLGGLSVAPPTSPPTETPDTSPTDLAAVDDTIEASGHWAFDAAELFETDPSDDAETAATDDSEIETSAEQTPTTDSFGVSIEETAAPEPAGLAVDWSSWDFDPDADSSAGDVFQWDTADLEPDEDKAAEPSLDDVGMAATDTPIDSVATADEIEDDLQELFSMVEVDGTEASQLEIDEQTEAPVDESDLASLEDLSSTDPAASDLAAAVEAIANENEGDKPDNVVPLHGGTLDYTEEVVGLDGAFDPARPQPVEPAAASEFVGVQEDEGASNDRWDYLRPGDDESVAGSFWSKRRKLFGGDERKAKKASRRQAEDDQPQSGPPCPKCSAPGNIDLDDPIGGKLHLSCHKCDHVWSQHAQARPESA